MDYKPKPSVIHIFIYSISLQPHKVLFHIMGKPTGFLEFTRELPSKRPVQERLKDYSEFVNLFPPEKLNHQAARCMDCGVPFCHNGCPLGNIIPEFNDAVYRESWEEAYEILISTNNFPEFTGRICPAPCESACVLGINQPPITIEEIEKHIIEIAFEKGLVNPRKPNMRTGKKVAVVGSGPAGLAAAAQIELCRAFGYGFRKRRCARRVVALWNSRFQTGKKCNRQAHRHHGRRRCCISMQCQCGRQC